MWNFDSLADIAASALRSHSQVLRAEQAVRGLDALPETGFHPLLAAGLAASGFGVFREQPYPGDIAKRPKHSARERCDLVLTHDPNRPLIDPLARAKEVDAAEGTLFQNEATDIVRADAGTDPVEACWIEVKAIGQFTFTRGIPGPNAAYSSELLTIARTDIPKLAREPLIRWRALLVILFSDTEATARHDLDAFTNRCFQKGHPIASPRRAGFPIPDHIGNTWCSIALVPVEGE